jgi:sugar lactone lactonase YvrE
VLEGHRSVVPEEQELVIDGKPLEISLPGGKTVRPRVGVNPIALDAANQWLYFGPMHGPSLYRVKTADLLEVRLSADELGKRVERWGEKPVCDGASMDNAGNFYVTDIANDAIGRTGPDGKYTILVRDAKLLSWPDAFSFGPDGYLYVVANQLHRGPALNGGRDSAIRPFYILRFKPVSPGVVGR